jgi:hypothetical protein
MLIIVMTTVIVVGLIAIALAEPRPRFEIVAWSDDFERRMLRERAFDDGWW